MLKRMRISTVAVSCLAAAVAWVQLAAAQGGANPDQSITDSPYKNGAPAVTGGSTDTSQGGAKTSGDTQAAPPSSGAQAATKGGQQQNSPDSRQQGEAQEPSDGVASGR